MSTFGAVDVNITAASDEKPTKRRKRDAAFRQVHEIEFGLEVASRDPQSHLVDSVLCRFCSTFGREERVGRRRKSTTNIKFFKRPFRSDNYRSHLESQHPLRWEKYRVLSLEDKKKYFETGLLLEEKKKYFETGLGDGKQAPVGVVVDSVVVSSPHDATQTKTLHVRKNSLPMTPFKLVLDKSIVTTIIADLLFIPSESTGLTKEIILADFKSVESKNGGGFLGPSSEECEIILSDEKLFRLAIQYMKTGSSYKYVPLLLRTAEEVRASPSERDVSVMWAAGYARVICAINLQRIADCLAASWAFCISLDSSTAKWGFFDIRCRVYVDQAVEDFHLLAMPITDRHTGDVVFIMLSKLLDTVASDWRKKIVGVTTDGDETSTEVIRSLASHLEMRGLPGFARIWYGARRLDHAVEEAIKVVCTDSYICTLTHMVSYLRHQNKLVAELESKCPRIVNTKWRSIHKVTKWISDNRTSIKAYLDISHASCTPFWWVITSALNKVLIPVQEVFSKLQGQVTEVSQQRIELGVLVGTLCEFGEVKGPLSPLEIAQFEAQMMASHDRFAVGMDGIRGFVNDLGLFVNERMRELSTTEVEAVFKNVAQFLVSTVGGISNIVAAGDSSNEAGSSLPPVLPHQLAKSRGREITAIILNHSQRLKTSFSRTEMDKIGVEHAELCRAYSDEPSLKVALDDCDYETGFSSAWGLVQNRFKTLRTFAGGLATVYPQKTFTDSKFAEMNWDYDDGKSTMADLGLESILHSEQYERLETVATR